MSERWAHCGICSRWFYVDQESLAVAEPRCPVCQTPAVSSVERDAMTEGAT